MYAKIINIYIYRISTDVRESLKIREKTSVFNQRETDNFEGKINIRMVLKKY